MKFSPKTILILLTGIIALLLASALLQGGCKNNPVEIRQKNPREYTWKIDTLAYPGSYQTLMNDVWGSSAVDVYVVGHNDRNRGKMWHYNGVQWDATKLSTVEGGSIEKPIDLNAIIGFNSTSIIAVGDRIYDNAKPPPNFFDSAFVMVLEGASWREVGIGGGRALETIWGRSAADLWVAGLTKTIYQYDGRVWTRDSLPVSILPGGEFRVSSIQGDQSGRMFVLAKTYYVASGTFAYYFFVKNMQHWTLVDSTILGPGKNSMNWGVNDLWMSPSNGLFSCGAGVFKWNGTGWVKLLENENALNGIGGTSDDNLFAVGYFGTVFHFNGIDWFQFKEISNPNLELRSVWTDGKELFLVGYTLDFPQRTIIIHGK